VLYHLFTYLDKQYDLPGAGLFSYITFRAGLGILVSLVITIFFGGRIIAWIKKMQVIEKQRALGLPGEDEKRKTPTMGGLMIILAILVPTLLLADLTNIYVLLLVLSTVWMGLLGFLDDYLKLTKGKDGLAAKYKLIGQIGLGLIVGSTLFFHPGAVVRITDAEQQAHQYPSVHRETVEYPVGSGQLQTMHYVKNTTTNVPFLKTHQFDYAAVLRPVLGEEADRWAWLIFIPFVIFIVTAVSNAANLTDGIDGLAAGVSAIVGATLGVLAYVSGHSFFSEYLGISYIPYSGEIVIFSACFLGACIGFLWFNAFPAQVFMGDTGSLTLGGIIAAIAIMIRKELLIPVLCGIFFVENLSVMLQVGYFKYTKKKYGEGRRIFKMAPLHHHFQKSGLHESKIVTRFLIVSIMLAVLTIITIKTR
jgi:phospho-N-acetylmuramoyl-pentapeptide-transferase